MLETGSGGTSAKILAEKYKIIYEQLVKSKIIPSFEHVAEMDDRVAGGKRLKCFESKLKELDDLSR